MTEIKILARYMYIFTRLFSSFKYNTIQLRVSYFLVMRNIKYADKMFGM